MSRPRVLIAVTTVLLFASPPVNAAGVPAARCSAPNISEVVGVPDLDNGSGGVEVRLPNGSRRLITRATIGAGRPAPGDRFGAAVVTTAAYQAHGCLGLAIGAPGVAGTGVVYLLTGTPGGVTLTAVRVLRMPGAADGDRFGAALADCNGVAVGVPGRDVVLAVGVPGREVAGAAAAGAVMSFSAGRPTLIEEGLDGTPGVPEPGDQFGEVLSCSYFSEHPLIGVPHEDVGAAVDAGMVVWAGSGQAWTQDSLGVAGTAENGDLFGAALSITDVIAIGVPGEDIWNLADAGIVQYLGGISEDAGVPFRYVPLWAESQDTPGVPGAVEAGDRFGASLALAALCTENGGTAVFAVGAPGEDLGAVADAGTVTVLDSGVALGFFLQPSLSPPKCPAAGLAQGSGLAGIAEAGDQAGAALGTTYGTDQYGLHSVLHVGVPGEDIGTRTDAGVVANSRYPFTAAGASRTLISGATPGARYGSVLPSG